MLVSYTMTAKEYGETNKLVLLHTSVGRKIGYYFCHWILPVLGVVMIGLGFFTYLEDHGGQSPDWILILLGVYLCLMPLFLSRRIRTRYRQQRLDQEWQVSINESGVRILRDSGNVDSQLRWPGLEKYIESDRMFLILHNFMSFIPIPKRAVESGEIENLRNFLSQHLP